MTEGGLYGPFAEVLPIVLSETEKKLAALGREGEAVLFEHILSRVKSEESMRQKLAREGVEATTENALCAGHDAVGIRIITRFIDDIYGMGQRIRAAEGWRVVREKDYIRSAKPNGYRSFHMILAVETPFADVRGRVPGSFFVEVQLRTIAMDTWAALEHELKYKKTIRHQELIAAELSRVASELAGCDVSMQTIRNLIRGGEGTNEDLAGGG